MNFRDRVSANLRYYRKINNLTMRDVADKCGVTEATIQKYETGGIKSIDIEMLEKLASAIGVTTREITGYKDGQEEHEAHLERVHKREAKWMAQYRNLSFENQKIVNNIINILSNGSKLTDDEQEIMRKLRYITPDAREMILGQLDIAYEQERKKQKTASS